MFKLVVRTIQILLYALSAVLGVVSIFFGYLYFQPAPSKKQIISECEQDISSGGYDQYDNPLQYCLEDFGKAEGIADGLWVISLLVLGIAIVVAFFALKLGNMAKFSQPD